MRRLLVLGLVIALCPGVAYASPSFVPNIPSLSDLWDWVTGDLFDGIGKEELPKGPPNWIPIGYAGSSDVDPNDYRKWPPNWDPNGYGESFDPSDYRKWPPNWEPNGYNGSNVDPNDYRKWPPNWDPNG